MPFVMGHVSLKARFALTSSAAAFHTYSLTGTDYLGATRYYVITYSSHKVALLHSEGDDLGNIKS